MSHHEITLSILKILKQIIINLKFQHLKLTYLMVVFTWKKSIYGHQLSQYLHQFSV